MVSQALREQSGRGIVMERNKRAFVTDKERAEIAIQLGLYGCEERATREGVCRSCAFFWRTGCGVTYSTLMACERRVLDAWRVRRVCAVRRKGVGLALPR